MGLSILRDGLFVHVQGFPQAIHVLTGPRATLEADSVLEGLQGVMRLPHLTVRPGQEPEGFQVVRLPLQDLLEQRERMAQVRALQVQLSQAQAHPQIIRDPLEVPLELTFGPLQIPPLPRPLSDVQQVTGVAWIQLQEPPVQALGLGALTALLMIPSQRTKAGEVIRLPGQILLQKCRRLVETLEIEIRRGQTVACLEIAGVQVRQALELLEGSGGRPVLLEQVAEVRSRRTVARLQAEGIAVVAQRLIGGPDLAVHDAQVVAGLVVVRLDLQEFLQDPDGLPVLSQPLVHDAQVVHGLRPSRPEAKRLLELRLGFLQATGSLQNDPEVVVQVRLVGVDLQAPPIYADGLLETTQLLVDGAQVVVRRSERRSDGDRPGELLDGLVGAAEALEHVAEIVVNIPPVAGELESAGESGNRLVVTLELAQRDTQVVMRLSVVLPELDGPPEVLDGPQVAPCPIIHEAEQIVGRGHPGLCLEHLGQQALGQRSVPDSNGGACSGKEVACVHCTAWFAASLEA